MRKYSSFLFAFLFTAFVSVQETKAIGVEKSARNATSENKAVFAPPAAPSSLVSTIFSSTQVSLGWQKNDTQDGVIVYYAAEGDAVYSSVTVSGVDISNYTLTGLKPNTAYFIDVAAYRGAETSTFSNEVIFTTPNVAPIAPSNLVIFPIGQTQVTLNWKDNSMNEDGFYILRSDSPSLANAGVVGSVGPNVTTFVDGTINPLRPLTNYYYTVASFNNNKNFTTNNSQPQNINYATGNANVNGTMIIIQTLPFPPKPPVNLKVDATGLDFAKISWSDFLTDYDSFTVERSVDQNSWFVVTTGIPGSALSFTDKNGVPAGNRIVEGVTYYYRVLAVNRGGNSLPPNPVVAAVIKKRTVPQAPRNFAIALNTTDPVTQIDLKWIEPLTDNLTDIPTSITVYRRADTETDYKLITTLPPYNTSSTFTDKNLKAKTKYFYIIRSSNSIGESVNAGPLSVTTLGPPSAPTLSPAVGGTDVLGNSIVTLNWKDNSDDEWSFVVERSIGDDKNFNVITPLATVLTNSVSFVNVPLMENVTYFYRIYAQNKYGNSDYSTITSVTTAVTKAPNAPFFLNAKASAQAEITLTWSDAANNEAKFEVERSADNKTFAKIGETLTNVLTYIDKSLADATLYYYRVRAVNSLGNSGYSAVASATTLAKKLAGLVGSTLQSDDTAWQVYPNPTVNSLKVTLPESIATEDATVRVVDKFNRQVLIKIVKPNGNGEIELDMSQLSEGTYTVNIQTDSKMISRKIVKF